MAPVLTLHQGDEKAFFAEHPIEVARKALIAAAEIEGEAWSSAFLRSAELLPKRGAVRIEPSRDDGPVV
jgi:hypothetical protein